MGISPGLIMIVSSNDKTEILKAIKEKFDNQNFHFIGGSNKMNIRYRFTTEIKKNKFFVKVKGPNLPLREFHLEDNIATRTLYATEICHDVARKLQYFNIDEFRINIGILMFKREFIYHNHIPHEFGLTSNTGPH